MIFFFNLCRDRFGKKKSIHQKILFLMVLQGFIEKETSTETRFQISAV